MTSQVQPVNVLIVDDFAENLVAFEALLKHPARRILLAPSGLQALEVLLAQEVAVAIIDVQMPEMTGFELAEMMRENPRTQQVPIIFVTAAKDDSSRLFRGYEAGGVDFLHKPVDPLVMKSKVDVFVQLHEQRRELARQVEKLEQAVQLNEAFLAVLGHDLRNPLSTIISSATLLSMRNSDEATKSVAARLLRSGHRMSRLIEQLLCFAQARAGKKILVQPVPTDLRTVVRAAVEDCGAGDKVVVDDSGDCTGQWDPDRLLQVFSNLLTNALRHGDPNAPVRVRLDGTAPDVVRAFVSNGGAIPQDLIPRMFQPFASGHPGGTGLGLYIVKQFIDGHGGAVAVRSSASEGTCFEITLPRQAAILSVEDARPPGPS